MLTSPISGVAKDKYLLFREEKYLYLVDLKKKTMTPFSDIKFNMKCFSNKEIIQENKDGNITLFIIESVGKSRYKILILNLKEKTQWLF